MKQYLFLLAAFISFAAHGQKLPYTERAQQYIRQHRAWAEAEQKRAGIPAAITLAQGVHETDAGSSELATEANNHFGIKCKKEWTGETFAHDDDAPQECFRKYGSALESYRDHSDYLKNSKRYQSCFALDATDYAGWARELRKCGYATNPVYAQKLIKIIEDYHLQDYTIAAMSAPGAPGILIASAADPVAAVMMAEKHSAQNDAVPDRDTPVDEPVYGQVIRKNGLKGFWAHKGDVLLEYAIQYKVRYAKLLEINGLPDAPLAQDQFVYLEHGGTVERMMAKDVSSPTQTPVATPAASAPPAIEIAASSDAPQPAESTPSADEHINTPVATSIEPAATPTQTLAPIPVQTKQPAAQAPARELSAAEAAAEAEARIFGGSAPVTTRPAQPVAMPAQNNNAASTPTEKPINIADEKAVEEQKAAEPQDEFSRLKARLDKVVYAPTTAKQPAPAATVTAPVTTPAVKAVTPASGAAFHTVKAGETAFGIAKQYDLTMKQLMDINKLSFGTGIKVGQKLRVK